MSTRAMASTALKLLARQQAVRKSLIPAGSRRAFSSAACALDEDLERERLYGGQPSPMSEFLDLAVNHGHTSTGAPPKYQLVEAPVLKCGISEDDLTFKTTSFGRLIEAPYVQHQEHKVTMCVRWHVLPLNDFEKRILMELVGGRYNPEQNQLKLTSDQFGSRIENKRHLTSMLDRLVFAARKLAVEATKQESVEATAVEE
ncbi:expressed unknown protein [Seminavis robusta]|uniref:Small ribosomal subunit protein mS35 mitochondrial conserved domain-containing protein n=1 Tax=Seminavis robusta TaxID=568900 RepID=A0A9N8DN61_9STRA|nr:expressed unknown protein [Seminavis robusta]|eukprot:Sro176_g077290.1 n/a (201) ;mRNA; f:23558-24160